jgi:ornithine cyclodeaminase/alanine dehydrogenase-like protein (mu-crystallin family)
MSYRGTLILKRSDIQKLMSFNDYVQAVEEAFRLYAEGKLPHTGVLDVNGQGGMFHIKAAVMPYGDDVYVAVKINGNFPQNKTRFALPTIQGAILLSDGIRGFPLAYLDSIEITVQRTGAATAVAAKYLARPDSKSAGIIGCGRQGRIQLAALKHSLPIRKAFAYDQDRQLASEFSHTMIAELGIEVTPVQDISEASNGSDVIVTCTTSKQFLLRKEHVRTGSFVAAVGADSHDKQELEPELLATSKVVTDIRDQCAKIGDLHHAISCDAMKLDDVHAELGEVVAGIKQGRTSNDDIFIFDSTGTAIQDVAAAAIVYKRAMEQGIGFFCDVINS